ncbi:hypothetical protein E3N88_23004 [Mikania micrantha]|uniref:Uncharacterized protein n=1 Tax=Mikania micrantha TaxID=192012 RepID=A0A5N6NDH8_9ASTR|nr:hypothetical protein E3N88_23004 [Mikania micrantha]
MDQAITQLLLIARLRLKVFKRGDKSEPFGVGLCLASGASEPIYYTRANAPQKSKGKGASSSSTPKVPPPKKTESKRLHQLIDKDDEDDEEMEEEFGVSEDDEEDVELGIDVDDDEEDSE